MGWSGRAPALPATNASRGHRRQGARHVTEARHFARRNRHRYREERPSGPKLCIASDFEPGTPVAIRLKALLKLWRAGLLTGLKIEPEQAEPPSEFFQER